MDLQGTKNADTLTGGADSDTIYGFAGNDTLKGLGGDDVLAGHDGNDILQGGAGDDYLLGGAGNDTLDGGDGNDWAAYEDATAGVKVDLNITGTQNTIGGGTDKLTGIENVYGSAFNDTLTGNADNNMLVGDAGNDVISGGKGDDTLWGDAGNDTLDGGDGDDYMVGGAGDDIIKGGAGIDWSSYENATAGVTVDLNKTTAQNTGGAGVDTITGVELLYGSKFDDVLTGDAKDNYLWGSNGNDKLYGGVGDDHLSGGVGNDVIDGGDGFDTADYAFSERGVYIDLQVVDQSGIVGWAESGDKLISIEALMGSEYYDVLVGNAAENYLYGAGGNDLLIGVGGNDTLDGGDGDDRLVASFESHGEVLVGGAGNDQLSFYGGTAILDGETGDDLFSLNNQNSDADVRGGEGIDTIRFYNGHLDRGAEFDLGVTTRQMTGYNAYATVQGVENVIGSILNDKITGDAKDNVIEGGDGSDLLDGGAGFDIAAYSEALAGVRVDLSKAGTAQNTRSAGLDTLKGFEGVKGSQYADILIGDANANTLEGGAGDDIMDGGAGADTAIYNSASWNYTWTRSANGIWTVIGAEGVDRLLNIETLRFTDKSVTLSPSETTVTVDDLLPRTQVLAVSAEGAISDALVSADGKTVYVADKVGYVSAIDTATGDVLGRWKVGTALRGMDISADGQKLVVTEGAITVTPGQNGQLTHTAKVYVLDLTTGQVKTFGAEVSGTTQAFADAAFMNDGRILLTQDGGGASLVSAPVLDQTTGAITDLYHQNGTISVSADRQHILIATAGVSSGPLLMFSDGQVPSANNLIGLGNNFGIQAISHDGGLVARAVYSGEIEIYDGALKLVTYITTFPHSTEGVYGMDFSQDGKHLFVVDSASDKVFEYSTTTWALEKVSSLGFNIDPGFSWGAGAEYGDRVQVIRGDQQLILLSPQKVLSVDLTSLTVDGGTDGVDMLVGGSGEDKLQGYSGDDIIAGGKGADILTGGKGADAFVLRAGDTSWTTINPAGVDVITDWEAGDHLVFGGTGVVRYGEQTAEHWFEAVTTASQVMAAQQLTHLAVQVANDVYVFAAKPGSTSGEIENVVKLANTYLDKVEAANFDWTPAAIQGDDAANLLIGSPGDDVIDGKGGNDIIIGGRGADTLTGGAGADVFKFLASEGGLDTSGYTPMFAFADFITDFGAGDKLAFANGPATATATDVRNLGHFDASPGANPVGAALTLHLVAQAQEYGYGMRDQKYMIFGVGSDTYIMADTDTVRGYDQVVVLKNVSSSLFTPDMIEGF